ncbi:Uncharacterized protein BP5553_00596 [Venustampulla echinocandica]|uniref:Erythromycin esterase n=1 Tax=Venustampulla echinocandica TaxID=2656787 RepID=A0A370TYL4_9HELO|nr:Uncharacterized protein BP5553_00596 [Venustampulla echinocandica]RDL40617.1 Uncharacterized protein BP5553_00596 [Venustampulla echinocandica]
MSPPRRRSSRLRGSTATPKPTSSNSSRPDSLIEHDESPNSKPQPNLNAILSSPSVPRTPATAARPKPSLEDMHPSKAHQSTAKEPDSGLRLGFTDIKPTTNGQPSGITQHTPSKSGISSAFDFRFARPIPQLGPEAQRMMDELREEALRIKTKLAAEKEERKRRGEEEDTGVGGRKIAQPKGKVGRYSDVHMAEFKKMDSIAGHASSFRAQPDRFPSPAKNLKRTQSRAKLDEREDISAKDLHVAENSGRTERLENTAPSKRSRKGITDDTSSARPVSRGNTAKVSTPDRPRSSNFLESITTPTQASLARAASAKRPGTQIPTLSRSPSKPCLTNTPRRLTKSATTNNLSGFPRSVPKSLLRSPGRFERARSILRQVSASVKKPTVTASSLLRSPSKPAFEKALPALPKTPGGPDGSKSVKHVNFTPDTINRAANIQNSPSPMKSGIPRSTSKANLRAKTTQFSATEPVEDKVQYPSLGSHPNVSKRSREVEYPSLAGVGALPDPSRTVSPQRPPPSVPSTFTFRSDHTIDFGSSPKGFGSYSGQASVRQVRQSLARSAMPGTFPGGNKENSEPLPALPHGMLNKKRKHVESDDERDDEFQRSPKKQKAQAAEGAMLMAPRIQAEKMTPKSRLTSPTKKKGGLSLSRLNMLARPKMRK